MQHHEVYYILIANESVAICLICCNYNMQLIYISPNNSQITIDIQQQTCMCDGQFVPTIQFNEKTN